jgi:hypothetical protein
MPSGGARARSGPARDPNALRRDRPGDKDGWTTLPAEGRTGEPPGWPLDQQSGREAELWASFWRKPVATIWERDSIVEVVALFVRQFAEGEVPKSSAENRKTIRLMMADLYLTPDSMLRAKLRISTDEVREKRAELKTPARKSARTRLKVVSDGQGA